MIDARNVVVFDNEGLPSIMVKFSKSKNGELFHGGSEKTHPAFIIDGEEVDEIYISKYPCTLINGKPYSLPYTKPATNITYDEAQKICFAKGGGWHLLTNAESALLTLISKHNDTLPHGNTNRGKDYNHPEESGACYDGARTLTGSGPATWAHDHTPFGVYDLCGNVWEWVAGLRLMNGEVQTIEDNNAATPVDMGVKSTLWKPVLKDGQPIRFDVGDGDIRLTTGTGEVEDWDGCRWNELQIDIEPPELLKALALCPADDKDGKAGLWVDTSAERVAFRGASFNGTSCAGVSALSLTYPRTNSYYSIGFRAAYYRRKADN